MQKSDAAISIVLVSVWAIAIFLVTRGRSEIPVSMLVIASLFFVLLIPAMRELVKTLDRLAFDRDDEPEAGNGD